MKTIEKPLFLRSITQKPVSKTAFLQKYHDPIPTPQNIFFYRENHQRLDRHTNRYHQHIVTDYRDTTSSVDQFVKHQTRSRFDVAGVQFAHWELRHLVEHCWNFYEHQDVQGGFVKKVTEKVKNDLK